MAPLRYVYAVCRPLSAPLQLTGVSGAPARQLEHHGLVAVVSQVPADADWRTMSRAHRNIVDALTGVTTPLPLRPGLVFPDDSAVRVMIEEREEEFRRALERIEGRVEWNLRVSCDDVTGKRARAGAEEFACRLHEILSGQAEDSRAHAPAGTTSFGASEHSVLDAAYLVPRSRSEEFVERVDRAEGEVQGIQVELTGPWAVYSFTGLPDAAEGSRNPV
ncbi:GvpL/GvpF family gas vesicle protein [Streptomyces sp. NPDC048664]|uniref:GvpL/GvpF family gas vesicle protein n=1 Tax=Streptomyces sp. NPDC048664 TaxID=3154505 RepID=UPI003427FABE